jgi:Thioredoxin
MTVVTPERFAKGRTFDDYVTYVGSPENLAREAFGGVYHADGGSTGGPRKDNSAIFRDRYAKAALTDRQAAAIKWLAAKPNGPANILVISEDWSSDCRRDVPYLQRLAEAGGLTMRIFNRDGKQILAKRRPDPAEYPDSNHDLMVHFLNAKNGGEWASVPVVVVYTKDFKELHRYIEFPSIYHKDWIRAQQNNARPGETAEQAKARATQDFAALQASPFFDIWASAAIDEILSGLHEKVVFG